MTDTNDWPDQPGVPLNPEQSGWHWVQRVDKGFVQSPRIILWTDDWTSGQFSWDAIGYSDDERKLGRDFRYLGPALTPAEVDARVKEARRDALEEAARLAKLYAQNPLKCVQCGDIRHDYNPGNCSGEKTYRESEEYKRKVLLDGGYSAMRFFEKHLCRPEPMDPDETFKTLAAAIRALVDVPSEVIIRADRDAWPDYQAKGMKEQGND